jgi:hypothetical protein
MTLTVGAGLTRECQGRQSHIRAEALNSRSVHIALYILNALDQDINPLVVSVKGDTL